MAMPQPPRISFSGDFGQVDVVAKETNKAAPATYDPDFEFIPTSEDSDVTMLPADELFFQGRLVPFWPSTHQSSTLEKVAGISVSLNGAGAMEGRKQDRYGHEIKERSGYNKSTTHGSMNCGSLSWLVDDDPSPRPPKCTVLWKELLKLKKQQSSEEAEKEGKRKKKGLERTRSASVRIRPFVKVPICTTTSTTNGKNIVLPR